MHLSHSTIQSKPFVRIFCITNLFALVMTGCGGGGGAAVAPSPVAQQCSANNPYQNDTPGTAKTPGSLSTEKLWLKNYFQSAYLWPEQIPNIDATLPQYSDDTLSLFGTSLNNYFSSLKSPNYAASGKKIDQFSFIYSTKAWNEFVSDGTETGYGIEWVKTQSTPPRNWRVALVQPGSPGAAAGVVRGDTLLQADGVDFVSSSDIDTINAALGPADTTTAHRFVLRSTAGVSKTVSMVSSPRVVIEPVPLTQVIAVGGGNVGYLAFHDHIATAEGKLTASIQQLKSANVTDLVLDLRYNSGGYVYIASQLAYMIAGPAQIGSHYFTKHIYNASRTADNNKAPTPFYSYSFTTPYPTLPHLGLSRVYVLTSSSTCSASESIINGLRGIGLSVHLIGNQTCGKPYGFTAKDNCGLSYFPIEFRGVNAAGFGDYSDGFIPGTGSTQNYLPGCNGIADDLNRALGDSNEVMLKTALFYRNSGNTACPSPAFSAPLPRNSALSGDIQNRLQMVGESASQMARTHMKSSLYLHKP